MEEVLDAIAIHRLVVILKARQIYMTWTMAGNALWEALFIKGARIILLSKKEDAAAEMLDYVRIMHSQLPPFLKAKIGKDQSTLLTFPDMNTKIRALATTADAGVGFGQASLIVADEWDFHDEAERNYAEIKPMIDHGGRFIALSAPNKYDTDTKFKEIWFRAKAKENNFHPIFIPYDVIPDRDEAWYAEQSKEYDKWELEGRYPKTEEEAMSAPQLVCRFDTQALDGMREMARGRIPVERKGLASIYKDYQAGLHYILTVDSSEGVEDPCACGVFEERSMERVAGFSAKIRVDDQAILIKDLYDLYNEPFTTVERRDPAGALLIEKLIGMGVTNWHCYKPDQPGWWTGSLTRPIMINDLANAIHARLVVEPSEDVIKQFYTFIKTKRKPDGEARKGQHDDWVIVWAMAWQLRKVMPVKTPPLISVSMTERW